MKSTRYARGSKKAGPMRREQSRQKTIGSGKICYSTGQKTLRSWHSSTPLRQKHPSQGQIRPAPSLPAASHETAGCSSPKSDSTSARLAAIPQRFRERREVIRAHTIKNTTSIEVVFLLFFFPPYIQIANRRRIGSNTRRRRLRCFHSSSVTRWLCSTIWSISSSSASIIGAPYIITPHSKCSSKLR